MDLTKVTQIAKEYQVRVLKEYKKVAIEKLHLVEATYQRKLDKGRKNRVLKSIQKWGFYWPQEPIVCTPDFKIIDGQHRWLAAREFGITHLPVTIFEFPNEKLEAAFFRHLNEFNSQLKPTDYWHSRYLQGDPIACFIYLLESDLESGFFDKIRIKGKNTSSKFSISQVLYIIAILGFGVKMDFVINTQRQSRFEILFQETDLKSLKTRLNAFINWLDIAFGEHDGLNYAYKNLNLKAIVSFYRKLLDENFLNGSLKKSANKMKSFRISNDFITGKTEEKINMLISHFNRGKVKRKIKSYE